MFSWLLHLVWRYAQPIYPALRWFVSPLHHGRQRYYIGQLASGWTVEGLAMQLQKQGFDNHPFPAWIDDGEMAGLRLRAGPDHQYHLRVFNDGEVRGHYEYTSGTHFWKHFWEVGLEPRREEFLKFLGEAVVPADEKSEK